MEEVVFWGWGGVGVPCLKKQARTSLHAPPPPLPSLPSSPSPPPHTLLKPRSDENRYRRNPAYLTSRTDIGGTQPIWPGADPVSLPVPLQSLEVQQGAVLALGHLMGRWCAAAVAVGNTQVEDMEHDGETSTNQGDVPKDRQSALDSCVKQLCELTALLRWGMRVCWSVSGTVHRLDRFLCPEVGGGWGCRVYVWGVYVYVWFMCVGGFSAVVHLNLCCLCMSNSL